MSVFRQIIRFFIGKPAHRRWPVNRDGNVGLTGAAGRAEGGERFRQDSLDIRHLATGFKPHLVGLELNGRCFVVDGDTIVIQNTTIRLAGIDAPEMDQPWGKKAKWELAQLCRGQMIRAVFDGTSSYERGVATCFLPDRRDLSAEMVKMGLALDWARFSGGKYRQHEPPGIRQVLWRVEARHRGRMPPMNTR